MAAEERDSTGEWLLPVGGGPPTLYDLEQRVEMALSVARAAEAAALEIGAASIEAAQQARRAAEMAERASLAAVAGGSLPVTEEAVPAEQERPALMPIFSEPVAVAAPTPSDGNEFHDERLRRFAERADRLVGRLRALEHSR